MSLHGNPIVDTVELPDGRDATIRVGVAEDAYIADRDLDTIVLEVRLDGRVAAVLNTVLDAADVDGARELAKSVREGLASGALTPTASALEPLADELR